MELHGKHIQKQWIAFHVVMFENPQFRNLYIWLKEESPVQAYTVQLILCRMHYPIRKEIVVCLILKEAYKFMKVEANSIIVTMQRSNHIVLRPTSNS